MRRCDIDKSSYSWAKTCGICHPGGGPGEYDRKGNRYDEFVRDPLNNIIPRGDNYLDGDYYKSNWEKSGILEADCLICHLEGYDWKARALALRCGFFYEAPMVGAGWYHDLKVSKTALPSLPDKALSFRFDYTKTKIAEGSRDCFRREQVYCDQTDCVWRKYCLDSHQTPKEEER